jgi:hypothetical protein
LAVLNSISNSPPADVARRCRSFLITWAALALGCLLPVAIFNLVIDPSGIFDIIRIAKLTPHRTTGSSRITKAELLHHQPAQIVLVGTSRAETGFDPSSPDWGTPDVLNLGLADTNMDELADVCRAAARSGRVRHIVLFLDFHIFRASYGRFDFDRSRFNPQLDLPNYYLASLLSSYKTTQSGEVLVNARNGIESPHTSRGFRQHYSAGRPLRSHREMFRDVLRGDMVSGTKYPYHISPEQVVLVGETIDHCRQHGVNLTIVLPPIHALKLEQLRALGLWPNFEKLKRDLVHIIEAHPNSDGRPVPFWDFTPYTQYSIEDFPDPPTAPAAERPMKWWWEASHFKSALGELIIARIMGKAAPTDFGILLTSANLDASLRRMQQDRDLYVTRHPLAMALLDEIAAEAGIKIQPR